PSTTVHPEPAPASPDRTPLRPAPSPSLLRCFGGARCSDEYPWRSTDSALDAQQHIARSCQHDEGNDEENKAERDQGGRIEIAQRVGEFVGDGGRNGGRRSEQR